jgi:Fur family peroxide stress response transcriptional regulator
MEKPPQERYGEMVAKFKQSGLKSTPQRLAIIRILSESGDHPGIDEICARLWRRFPGIGRATVYRNILLIKSLEEVLEIGLAGGRSRYDGRKPYPHPHLICLSCGKIIDPDLANLPGITKKIAAESGFEIKTYRLDFFGWCPACRKQQKATTK